MQKREILRAGLALGGLLGLGACGSTRALGDKAHVVVVGGGFGGATAAKYLRLLSEQRIRVTLIEPRPQFVSCPLSNLVVGGSRQLAELTLPYTALQQRHGVKMVQAWVKHIDHTGRQVQLDDGQRISYDKLIISPGIDMQWDAIKGLRQASEQGQALQAWQAGPETQALRAQLQAMPDGGVYAISIPEAPYRCPPGPYERASQVAHYFKQHKPRSKVLILDANQDVTSKGALFKRFWAENYGGIIEYRPEHRVVEVDGRERTLRFDFQDSLRADVLNVLPPMHAGRLAMDAGLANANGRWCQVHYRNFLSTAADVHVIGDAIQVAPGMPKSGHMANAHAKAVAAAVVAELAQWPQPEAPLLTNTCYSYVDDQRVIHVASVHQYDDQEKTYQPVKGSGGVSAAPNELEGVYAWNWARTIWADSLL